jgi:ribonuclease D
LNRKNLLTLAGEDFNRLSQVKLQNLEPTSHAWQISGSQKLDARQLTVLKKLWEMREKSARQQNRPVFKIMSTDNLLDLAAARPKNARELMSIGSISRSILERYQDAILEAVHQGLISTPISRSHPARPSQAFLFRMDRLKHWRTQAARELGVESDIVLPRESLEAIAKANPGNLKELRSILNDQNWRIKKFGAEIIRLLAPKEKK